MTAAAPQEHAQWSRLRWAATITFVVAIQLVLVLALNNRPVIKQRRAEHTQVVLPAGMAPVLQRLTDPTLLALGGPHGFSAVWRDPPQLQPVPTDWEQPPQWLGLRTEKLGERFLDFAQSNASTLHGLGFKTQPRTIPEGSRPGPAVLMPHSTLYAADALKDRGLLSKPDLPSWSARDMLAPTEVRVVVDARGRVTSAILRSGSGLAEADLFAVQAARQVRFAPVRRDPEAPPLTLGMLVFKWHTQPQPANGVAPNTQ